MELARRVGPALMDGKPVGLRRPRCATRWATWLIYGPLRNALGMSRVRVAYTAGEAIGPDLFAFYRSIGINLKQLYGSTETAVFVCVQPNGEVRADTVGLPMKGVEISVPTPARSWCARRACSRSTTRTPQATPRCRRARAGSTPATPASSTPAGT